MPENVDYQDEIKEEIVLSEKYHAQVISFIDLERYFTKDSKQHDYDTSSIELTVGYKWGEHGTVYFKNHEQLRDFANTLIDIANRTRDSHISGVNQMPEDFAPEFDGLDL